MGIHKNTDRILAIVRLYCENNTLQFVADAFGITRQAVEQVLKREGINTKRRPIPKPLKPKRTFLTSRERFWLNVDRGGGEDSCWLWIGKSKSNFGYGKMYFQGKSQYSHHLAWFFTYGKFAEQWILHDCGNAGCCNPKHLKDEAPKVNAQDRIRHGTNACGERIGNAKLKETEVMKIKKLLSQGKTLTELAVQYDVAISTISAIAKNKAWAHVEIS